MKFKSTFIFSFFLLLSLQLEAQPNIVLILTDDQGWTGSSVQMDANIPASKSDFYFTPWLEALAAEGMTFSHAYAPAAKCSPSRCSILTGRTPARNNFTNTGNDLATGRILIETTTNTAITPSDTTIAEWLKSTGLNYETAHFGKWHLGNGLPTSPTGNGFDVNDGSTSNGDGSQGGVVQEDPKKIFELTDKSIDFMQQSVDNGNPFYLQLSHYAVHTEIEARQATIDLYNDPTQRPMGTNHTGVDYAAMTEDTDTGIGLLLEAIADMGITENTYIIFTSDNGGQSNVTDNTPLSRGKTFIYEGGIRVPFIIRGPNIPANTYNSEPIVAYDLFPTIAALTNSGASLPAYMDGQNIAPLFTNESFTREKPIYFHSPHYENNQSKTPRSAAVEGPYKLIVEYETGNNYLFNLSVDIEENDDLSGSEPDLAYDLCIKLRDYLKSVNAAMPMLNPDHGDFSGVAPDVDNDGLDDAWEVRELLSFAYGPMDDPDGDGKDNITEYNEGTDPYVSDITSNLSELNNAENQLRVFPNPTSELLQVQIDDLTVFPDLFTINIIDTNGRLVKQIEASNNAPIEISVKGLAVGKYYLSIKTEEQSDEKISIPFVVNQ